MKTSIAVGMLLLLVTAPLQAEGLQDDLMARENAYWTAWQKRDAVAYTQDSSDDIVQVLFPSGRVSGKEAVAKAGSTHDCTMKSFELANPQMRQITPDVVMLHYHVTQDASCGSSPSPASMEASALYVRREGKWLATSYQETPAE